MSLLTLEGLTVRIGGRAVLDDVSLSVGAGEVVGLIGRSGAGKSTLLAAAIGLLEPEAAITGRVRIAGHAPAGEAAWRPVRGATVGLVMQDPAAALNPARTIGFQVVEAARRHRGLARRMVAGDTRRRLAEVGLDLAPGRYPHQISGGQRQRVAIAAAIAGDPALLLADEPTAALDPVARAELAALIARLARERGMGLLLVSHDLPLVAGLADRLAVLDDGRLVEQGPALERLADPRSSALKRMVAAENGPGVPIRPRPAGDPLLVVERVTRHYRGGDWLKPQPHVALADVDLAVAPGETVALVGASGSGKTTLARLALGLDRPDGGRILLAGQDRARTEGAGYRATLGRVQAVFQDPAGSLDPLRTVGDSVAEPLRLRPGLADRRNAVAAALASVGLPASFAGRLPGSLSGGQRQRVALARALVLDPPLLVLDEALSALDAEWRAELADRLAAIQAARGTALLLVSHDLALVRRLAHRMVVLRDGRVVETGETAAVLAYPRDPYTTALVAASPTLDQALSRRAAPPSVPTIPASPPR